MVKKFSKTAEKASANNLIEQLKESSTQIWLAGLGAFSKAQEEGGKVFEALVKEGAQLQSKVKRFADSQVNDVTNEVTGRISDATSKAQGAWDRLESVFEERVGRAVNRLGVPSKADIEALLTRVDALTEQVARLNGESAGTAGKPLTNGATIGAKTRKAASQRRKPAASKAKPAAN